jgi:hypothetical protein
VLALLALQVLGAMKRSISGNLASLSDASVALAQQVLQRTLLALLALLVQKYKELAQKYTF